MIDKMKKTIKNSVDWFIRDKDGHIKVAQIPNVPLAGWLVCMIIARVIVTGSMKSSFSQLSQIFLAIWSYLEITQGASRFRRTLGVFAALSILYSLFR